MKKETGDVHMSFISCIPNIKRDDRGKTYKSKCICGGEITAVRSTYNGHLHARCSKCGMTLME